jgi:hypothetical protein
MKIAIKPGTILHSMTRRTANSRCVNLWDLANENLYESKVKKVEKNGLELSTASEPRIWNSVAHIPYTYPSAESNAMTGDCVGVIYKGDSLSCEFIVEKVFHFSSGGSEFFSR